MLFTETSFAHRPYSPPWPVIHGLWHEEVRGNEEYTIFLAVKRKVAIKAIGLIAYPPEVDSPWWFCYISSHETHHHADRRATVS